MIHSLCIQNFKGWKNTGTIELAPLTVFFGSNSSGKSSIGQFLMLLKQSIELSDRKSVLYPGNENTAVDLGLPSDMVYKQDLSQNIMFSYNWDLERKLLISDALHQQSYMCDSIRFDGSVRVVDSASQALEVNSCTYQLYLGKQFQMSVSLEHSKTTGIKRGYKLSAQGYELVRSSGRPWDVTAPIRFYGFPDEAVAYYQNTNFLNDLNLNHERLFSSIYYLGPLRTKAKRLYQWGGIRPSSVGTAGENAVSAILAARNEGRKINLKNKSPRMPFEQIVAKMLMKMGLIEGFEIHRIENRQDYDVKVKTRGSDNFVDIPDVGFGVSQVLPVIVELFYAPKNSIIVMEQPELHLHPDAQAKLADVMLDAIQAKEGYKDRNIQLIVETHSEHFLRRLQRRIAEQRISPDAFRAYFADNSCVPATLESLQVDLFGEIINWPHNFFGDMNGDIVAQAHAGIKRRMKG